YDFVTQKMTKVRDLLSEIIRERSEQEYSVEYKNMFHKFYEQFISDPAFNKREKPRVLILGYCSTRLLIDIEQLGFKVVGIEISRNLVRELKASCKEIGLKSKWISKDFFKNSFEENYFDAIFLNNYWSIVPQDSEISFQKFLKKSLKSSGKLVINSKISKED